MKTEFTLQISIGQATAGAVFRKQAGQWICTEAAPYLRKLGIVGMAANDAKAMLKSKRANWSVVSQVESNPNRKLRKQSDGEYDHQVRCSGDAAINLMPCQYLGTKRIYEYGERYIDWCSARIDPGLKKLGSDEKGWSPMIDRWRNCNEYQEMSV